MKIIATSEYTTEELKTFLEGKWNTTKQGQKFFLTTVDNVPMVDGKFVFMLMDTHGLPLEIIIDQVYDGNLSICWTDFYNAACKAGRTDKQIYKTIKYAVQECLLSNEHKTKFMEELDKFFQVEKEIKENIYKQCPTYYTGSPLE